MNPNEWEWIAARAVWSQPPVDVGGIARNISLALLCWSLHISDPSWKFFRNPAHPIRESDRFECVF